MYDFHTFVHAPFLPFFWPLHVLPRSLQVPGDVDAAKAVNQIQKTDKAPSPFEGEKVSEQEAKDVIQANGIIQNGLEEDKYIR